MENLPLHKIQLGNNQELLDALYSPCTVNDVLGLEDYLKLPVSDAYREMQLKKREEKLCDIELNDGEIISNNININVSKSDSTTDK
jgi:hypothetical protein